MPRALQRKAQDHHSRHHERRAEPEDHEPKLGLESAFIATGEEFGSLVMEPVANDLADESGNDWREIIVTNLLGSEAIKGCDEDGKRGVDADDPGESEKIVDDR